MGVAVVHPRSGVAKESSARAASWPIAGKPRVRSMLLDSGDCFGAAISAIQSALSDPLRSYTSRKSAPENCASAERTSHWGHPPPAVSNR